MILIDSHLPSAPHHAHILETLDLGRRDGKNEISLKSL